MTAGTPAEVLPGGGEGQTLQPQAGKSEEWNQPGVSSPNCPPILWNLPSTEAFFLIPKWNHPQSAAPKPEGRHQTGQDAEVTAALKRIGREKGSDATAPSFVDGPLRNKVK